MAHVDQRDMVIEANVASAAAPVAAGHAAASMDQKQSRVRAAVV